MDKPLSEMDERELKKQKSVWYAEALNTGKLTTIHSVCETLGERVQATYGPKYEFLSTGKELYIYVDNYGSYSLAKWKGKEVMNSHPCTQLFIPGPWFDLIEQLYAHSLAIKAMRINTANDIARKALLDTLTLPD